MEDAADAEAVLDSPPRRVIVDTDTATDDALALLLLARSPGVEIEGVTVVGGNVPFDRQVENAKYALSLAGKEDVPVYEGAREPLVKEFEHATDIHGEGGLGGDFQPETGVDSADEHAVEFLGRAVRESPGEFSLVCIGPLTNVALALALDPDLADALCEVYVMGGAVHMQGNVTPAAEFNFWVDPDAAVRVLRDLDVTLLDWGLSTRQAVFDADDIAHFSAPDTPYADFFETVVEPVLSRLVESGVGGEGNVGGGGDADGEGHADGEGGGGEGDTAGEGGGGEDEAGVGVAQPDLLTAAVAADPDLVTAARDCTVEVDSREGLTRGHTVADVRDDTNAFDASETSESTEMDADVGIRRNVRLVESIDEERFEVMVEKLIRGGPP